VLVLTAEMLTARGTDQACAGIVIYIAGDKAGAPGYFEHRGVDMGLRFAAHFFGLAFSHSCFLLPD
jgi:hypothetical protein